MDAHQRMCIDGLTKSATLLGVHTGQGKFPHTPRCSGASGMAQGRAGNHPAAINLFKSATGQTTTIDTNFAYYSGRI
jgi:hypothetical protein